MIETQRTRGYPDFGYTAAMEAALQAFSGGSRGTGRTTRLIQMAEPGTVIFVHNSSARHEVEAILRTYKKSREVTVAVMMSDGSIPAWINRSTKVLFDSPVIEEMMRRGIAKALDFADYLDRQAAVNREAQAEPEPSYRSFADPREI